MNYKILFAASLILTFLLTVLISRKLIPALKSRKMGQKILDIGPRWHKSKEGTPTMGGILIMLGFFAAVTVTLITDKLLGGNLLDELVVLYVFQTEFVGGVVP